MDLVRDTCTLSCAIPLTPRAKGIGREFDIADLRGSERQCQRVFAGAICDHLRGTIVGQNSYAKGSVQSIFSLGDQTSGLRLTTAKF